jgi:isopentenyl diphosphate isomerase/L-lactate dehydrogenase-like FMN-dependent dehydrogenase
MRNIMNISRAINIEDLRRMAESRLPRVVFDYLDGGAEGEITLRENCSAFQRILLRPRQAVAVGRCDLSTRVLGHDLAMPIILAPVGYSRLMHHSGEVAAAKLAGECGLIYALSTISGYPLEDVKAATPGPAWYQLYLLGGRESGEAAIERARQAGYSALVLTIDTGVSGMRERDLRNGMKELLGSNPLKKIPFVANILAHPGWLISHLVDGGMPKLHNVIVPGRGPMALLDVGAALGQSVVTWDDMKWIRAIWPGTIIVKGILGAEDARRAVDAGAAAIVVSNHGGRQLDCVPPTIQALPEIVAAVGTQVEVLMDGGIRRGSDIVKALCLGARAVLIGRAYTYGLAAAGYVGVRRALQILRADLERTLKLLGCRSVRELDESFLA